MKVQAKFTYNVYQNIGNIARKLHGAVRGRPSSFHVSHLLFNSGVICLPLTSNLKTEKVDKKPRIEGRVTRKDGQSKTHPSSSLKAG